MPSLQNPPPPSRFHGPSQRLLSILLSETSAWLVLGLSLCLTILAWLIANQALDQRMRERFDFEVADAKLRIQDRMLTYEQALKGGRALWITYGQVSRTQWKQYVTNLQLQEALPGLQGFAFSQFIPAAQLANHEANMRAQGFANYQVRPVGKRDVYTAITMIEPFDARNQRAFGFDMYSEPVRRAAMNAAINSGNTTVSGLVTLVQENGLDVQTGFLMYLPVYRTGQPTQTQEQRQQAILGFVYSPFRAKDLMKSVLGEGKPSLSFKLYDSPEKNTQHLLLDTGLNLPVALNGPTLQSHQTIDLPGRQWHVVFEATPKFIADQHNDSPNIILLAGVAIDILLFIVIASLGHQRRQQQLQTRLLQASQARYQNLVQGLSKQFAFFTLDAKGRLLYASPSLATLLGLTEQTTLQLQRGLLDQLPIKPGDSLFEALLQSLEHCVPSHFIYTSSLPTPDQQPNQHTLEGFLSPMCSETGQLQTLEGVLQDITQRQATEAQLDRYRLYLEDIIKERTQALQAANRAKSLFLANMSHEIRTPLHAIIGLNQLLQNDIQDNQAQQRLQHIQSASQHLLGVLDDVLSYTRIESGLLQLQQQEFNFGQTFQNTLDAFTQDVQNKGLTFAIQPDTRVPSHVLGDAQCYRQVLSHLVANAIKFSQTGDIHVRFRLEAQHGDILMINTRVEDEGCGIDPNEIDRLLQPFEQADNSANRNHGGTGLGLAICQRLVQLMGGMLRIQSTPGVGTVVDFSVRVACAKPSQISLELETQQQTEPNHSEKILSGLSVLVVEDNTLNQHVIKALLDRMLVNTTLVEHGERALHLLQQGQHFDVVLMDMHMPVMNGLDTTRAIRAMAGPTANIPIVALTACAMKEDEEACKAAGMNDYLSKPVNIDHLRALLEKYAQQTQAQQSTQTPAQTH